MRQRALKLVEPYLSKLRGGGISAILARGASGAFVVNVAGTGVNFGVQILLARLLGAQSYGDYVYALTWINILVLLGKLGLDTAALRFVSAYSGRGEWGLLRGFLRRSTQIVLGASAAIALVVAASVWFLLGRLGPELSFTFLAACLVLPVMAVLEVRVAYLQATKRVVQAKGPHTVLRPLLLGVGVALVALTPLDALSAPVAMVVTLVATAGALALTSWYWGHALPAPARGAGAEYETLAWSRVGWSLLLVSGLLLVLNQTDIIMIGYYLGTKEAGIYATASRVATLTLFGLTAVSTIAAPMFSEFYSQGRMGELQRVVTLAARGIMAFSVPVSLVMVLFGGPLLSLFGPEFAAGYWPLVILTAGQLVNASVGSVGFLMSMTGHQGEAARVFAGAAVVNVVLNAALIPLLGTVGSALATAATTAGWNVILALYVWKRLRVRATAL